MMIYKITPFFSGWNVWTLNLINQLIKILYKFRKLFSQRIQIRYYKTSGTSVIYSPMSPPFLHTNPSQPSLLIVKGMGRWERGGGGGAKQFKVYWTEESWRMTCKINLLLFDFRLVSHERWTLCDLIVTGPEPVCLSVLKDLVNCWNEIQWSSHSFSESLWIFWGKVPLPFQ